MKSLRISIFAFAVIAFSFYSCKTTSEPTGETVVESTNLPVSNINSGILTGDGAEGIGSPKEFVIQSEEEWESLRTKMNSVNQTQKEVSIDFENKTILAYFDQIRTTGGYAVQIIEVTEKTHGVEAVVKFTAPTGMATEIMTQPFHIVSIPKTSKAVKFVALIE